MESRGLLDLNLEWRLMILVGVCQGVGDIWAIIGRSLGDQVGKM